MVALHPALVTTFSIAMAEVRDEYAGTFAHQPHEMIASLSIVHLADKRIANAVRAGEILYPGQAELDKARRAVTLAGSLLGIHLVNRTSISPDIAGRIGSAGPIHRRSVPTDDTRRRIIQFGEDGFNALPDTAVLEAISRRFVERTPSGLQISERDLRADFHVGSGFVVHQAIESYFGVRRRYHRN